MTRRVVVLGASALLLGCSSLTDAGGRAPVDQRIPAMDTNATGVTTTAGEQPAVTARPLSPFSGDPFFDPGDAEPGAPGEIIRARQTQKVFDDAEAWDVLHWSRTALDQPVAVSATIVVPSGGVATDRPVFAYAHLTTGMGDQCSLTDEPGVGTAPESRLLPEVLERGITIVAPNYEGLGTPGDHPYLVGQAEGRNVLDAIRAAARLEGSGVTSASRAVAWGHSQGGQAAAFAAELQPTYAPEVDLVGAVVGAPAGDLSGLDAILSSAPPEQRGYVPMIIAGLRAGYPALSADDDVLSPDGLRALTAASTACLGDNLDAFRSADLEALFGSLPLSEPRWRDALAANRIADRSTSVPILNYIGEHDPALELNREMFERYCALGVTASQKIYLGRDHMDVLDEAFADILTFTQSRLRGDVAQSNCA